MLAPKIYWECHPNWKSWKCDVEELATSVSNYATYLEDQNKKMKLLHSQFQPVRHLSENISLMSLPTNSKLEDKFRQLEHKVIQKQMFEYLCVEHFPPSDPHKKYIYIQRLQSRGIYSHRVAMLTYYHGNNIANFHFIW